MYSHETLVDTLSNYCNWQQALPRELLLSAIDTWAKYHGGSKPGSDATNEDLQASFLRLLACSVPLEWTVTQHSAFSAAGLPANSSKQQKQQQPQQQQTTMHAQAVGTPYGITCFGGMELGKLTEMKVKSEVSWIREYEPRMLQPDFSRVYQASPSQLSKQVMNVTPGGKGCSWSAHAASPSLPIGLMGHSVVLHGSRVFIFGGLEAATSATVMGDDGTPQPATPGPHHTTNKLRAYAIDAAGTQGGLLPVLSDNIPQMGATPSSRMYHRAAVDPDGGVMYVYGGVHIRDRDGARLPADQQAGTVHCFDFQRYTWNTLHTTGSCRPCSTTLLACCWHQGALWVIPDVPTNSSSSSSSRSSSTAGPPGYRLLRLDVQSKVWQEVNAHGTPPCLRSDACSIYHKGKLLIYGGKTTRSPISMLSDLHVLDLDHEPPVWQQVSPRSVATTSRRGSNSSSGGASSSSGQQQQQQLPSLLPLAGHAGGVDGEGRVVFYGGYRRYDVKEPQPLIQVLQHSVKPPTPEAARLSEAAAAPLSFALQHVRQQLARLVRQHHPQQVLLRPDGGGGVRLPARLLALYSCLFDDMFQDMLQQQDEEDNDIASQQPQVVPVPGVSLEGIAAVCRWVMGLLALGSCSMDLLVEMYRVADRLIMERLMVEVLEVLGAADISQASNADALLRLTGDLSGRADVAGLGARATRELRQQVSPATAPAMMALARQHKQQALQERCVEVMHQHRKNDVWAVLEFALRFNLPRLQGSCLAALSHSSRGRIVDRAERIVKVASRHCQPNRPLSSLTVTQMLEKDLLAELSALLQEAEEQQQQQSQGPGQGLRLGLGPEQGAGQLDVLSSLPSYVAAAERLGLGRLRQGLIEGCSKPNCWRHLQQNKQLLQQLQQRFPDVMQAAGQRAATG